MKSKMKPADVSRVLGDSRDASHRPRSTPIKLVAIKADPAPKNTTQGAWDSAAISRVAIWVLSPISARKMVKKVEANTPQAPGVSCFAGLLSFRAPALSEG